MTELYVFATATGVPLVLWFLFSGGDAEAEVVPEAGSVVLQVEPVAINLAGGSYLKLGLTARF